MKTLMCRLWISQRGTLSRGDLVWAAGQLDEAENRVPGRERIINWVVTHISPFPVPRTIPEHVARAMAWAVEKVKSNQRKRILIHTDALDSNFIKGDALRSYEKTRDVYKLACSICSVVVKNRAEVSEARICEIIEEIDTFLARNMSRYAATEIAA